ncbi:unnamed protein product [Prorocentrum cordatum]|uniref:Uncharacterized protein n=1 Tax=Prorocentrum cordatum TaxID=2364126 RepID=A0ABN9X2S7_9DINO|nr:unnamed protein product [Polarella glacialis]
MTPASGTSGGVAVMRRIILGLAAWWLLRLVPKLLRIGLLPLRCPPKRDPFVVVSYYLRDCQDLSDHDMFILYKIGRLGWSFLRSYTIGSDFNMPPARRG